MKFRGAESRPLAGSTNMAFARLFALQLASHSRLPMSKHSEIDAPLSPLAIYQIIGASIGTVLALAAIAAALIIAAAYPALNGNDIAVATGVGIGAIALAVTVATTVVSRLRLPSHNDAWVFW